MVAAAPASSAKLPAVAAPPSKPSSAPQAEPSIEIDMSSGEGGMKTELLDKGDLSPEFADAEAALEAMTNFRLAETALQRGDIPGAEKLATKAVRGDPEQAEYRVLLAWIRAMGANPNAVEEAIAVMSQVLDEDPSNERALLYRGKLYKRTGKAPQAQKDFNALLASNPQHREAASEVRLLKMKK
jgi:tetratricopeptide (TPR) repeat protein